MYRILFTTLGILSPISAAFFLRQLYFDEKTADEYFILFNFIMPICCLAAITLFLIAVFEKTGVMWIAGLATMSSIAILQLIFSVGFAVLTGMILSPPTSKEFMGASFLFGLALLLSGICFVGLMNPRKPFDISTKSPKSKAS